MPVRGRPAAGVIEFVMCCREQFVTPEPDRGVRGLRALCWGRSHQLGVSVMQLDDLKHELGQGKVRPAYLLGGAEPLLREEGLVSIRNAVVEPQAADFNVDRLHGSDTSSAALQDSLQSLPIMAERRLVILLEPENRRGSASKALTDTLAQLVSECADWTQTVLVVSSAKLDRRARWVKAFREPAALLDCQPPKPGKALLAFIEGEAQREEIVLAKGVPNLLAERMGPQLMLIRQEVSKLRLLVGEGETVTRDHILESSRDLAEQPIWDLTDAIGAGHAAEAIRHLNRILEMGAPDMVVLAGLATHFRRLTRVREGLAVSGPPFVVRKLEKQARRYSLLGLRRCLEAIHGVDLALKGAGKLRDEAALESLVLDLSN